MKLSTNYNDFIKVFGHEEGLKKMKEVGYEACDFGISVYKNPLDKTNMLSDDEFVAFYTNIKNWSKKYGVEIYQTHAGFFTQLDSYSAEYRRAYVEYMQKEIDATFLVGSKIMVVHPMFPYDWEKDETPDKTFELNVSVLKELCEYAQQYGVKIALENMPRVFESIPCNSPKMLMDCYNAVNMPNLGFCIDTGHANYSVWNNNAPCADCSSENFIRICEDKILCLHIHDNMGLYDEHSLPYDTCMNGVNWKETMKALTEVGYRGTFNSEANFSNRYPKEFFMQAETFVFNVFKWMLDNLGK